MKVAVLIPALNEARTLPEVILDCQDVEEIDEIYVCDDGSSDSTWKLAKGLLGEENVIHHESNMGKGEALRSLFLKAIDSGSDVVCSLDADGQHNPADIPRLLRALKDNDIVIGSRMEIRGMRAMGNRLLSNFSSLDTQSGFRAYHTKVLSLLMPTESGPSVDSEILDNARRHNLRIGQVPVSSNENVPNPHKAHIITHFMDVFFSGLRFASFRHPFLFFGLTGLAFVMASMVFGFRSLYYASQGNNLFPLALENALLSNYLLIIGLSLASAGLIIWVTVSSVRKLRR